MLNAMVSRDVSTLESRIAWRSEPGPESSVFLTVIVIAETAPTTQKILMKHANDFIRRCCVSNSMFIRLRRLLLEFAPDNGSWIPDSEVLLAVTGSRGKRACWISGYVRP